MGLELVPIKVFIQKKSLQIFRFGDKELRNRISWLSYELQSANFSLVPGSSGSLGLTPEPYSTGTRSGVTVQQQGVKTVCSQCARPVPRWAAAMQPGWLGLPRAQLLAHCSPPCCTAPAPG